VSLAVMCNLHKMRSPRRSHAANSSSDVFSLGQMDLSLSPPRDALEEGERIRAWWTTFILDKCWVIALASPSTIVEDELNVATRIDTPWPLELATYGDSHPSGPNAGNTIQNFIDGLVTGRSDRDSSPLATIAKAATLYELANRSAALWEKNIGSHQGEFVAIDTCIERFKQTLPTIDQVANRPSDLIHNLLMAHTLSQTATIQLHLRFITQNSTSRSRCLAAANAIVRVLQLLPIYQLKYLNPTIAVFWSTASEVLAGGLGSLRSMRTAWASSSALPGDEVLIGALGQLVTAAEHFSNTSLFMSSQFNRIRQSQAIANV